MEIKDKLIIKTFIANKQFTDLEEVEFTINLNGFDENNNVQYTSKIPDYLFDYLVDDKDHTSKYRSHECMKQRQADLKIKGVYGSGDYNKDYFKKGINGILISSISDTLQTYSHDAITKKKLETTSAVKRILVRFVHSRSHERWNMNAAYMGESVASDFQFFIAYEIEEMSRWNETYRVGENDLVPKTIVNYYTRMEYHPPMSTTAKLNTIDKESKNFTLLHSNAKNEREAFKLKWQVIDWTQEREDYLTNIKDKFHELNLKLHDYLGNMDNNKIEQLMVNADFKLLTGHSDAKQNLL